MPFLVRKVHSFFLQVADGLLGSIDESSVVGSGIAWYVAEEQVAEFCVLHITRTLVHKAEALLYQGGFPHKRGAVVVVKHDIEGCIGCLIVKLGNLVAEGFLLTLLIRRGRIKVGDVVKRVFLGADGCYGGIWIGYLYHEHLLRMLSGISIFPPYAFDFPVCGTASS